MKGKSKKSTYSTTFGIDPKFTEVCAKIPHKQRLPEWKAFVLKKYLTRDSNPEPID